MRSSAPVSRPTSSISSRAAADALGNSLTNRTSNGAAQRGATIGLDAEATRGRQAVKVLDSLVEPLIQGNLALLGQWAAAKRFGGKVERADEHVDRRRRARTDDVGRARRVAIPRFLRSLRRGRRQALLRLRRRRLAPLRSR